jgi:hypothetical protein
MRYLMGMALASGMILIGASESHAQFGVSVGNPYPGRGIAYRAPAYGYSSGYTGYGFGAPGFYYNSGYRAGPGTFGYSSGYRGYVAPINPYRYGPSYGAYGYGYGARAGFRPFRGVGRVFR